MGIDPGKARIGISISDENRKIAIRIAGCCFYLSKIDEGLYILNPDVLKLIPGNTFLHITHLIEKAKNQGLKVGVFPIDDDAWIDVGQWAEYRKAIEKL